MNIASTDTSVILAMRGNELFVKRDESPGIFFIKYGEIWTRFMNDSAVSDWWQQKYGAILRTDEQSRLRILPTQEQLLETLLFVQKHQNQQCDAYDACWTDARRLQADLDDRIIPQKPMRIDLDFERMFAILMTSESAWTGISFVTLFRGLQQQKTFRVATYLIASTLWTIWNPKLDRETTQAGAIESLERRREQNRLNMQRAREELKRTSGFGDHSKNLTHVMQEYAKRESSIAKMTREIESLKSKLARFNDQQQHAFDVLTQYLNNPITHSESQHDKLKELLKDDESPW